MMDGVTGGVVGLKWPFHEQTVMLREKQERYFSSIGGKQAAFRRGNVKQHVVFFHSDSRNVIAYKSMGTLILIYNLVNQHPVISY